MPNGVVNEHAQGSFFRVATRMTDKLGNRIRSECTFNRKKRILATMEAAETAQAGNI